MTVRLRAGFTLLESIVALAIVSIVCIGVLAAQGTALRAEATAASRLPLAALAEDRIAAIDLYDGRLDVLPDTLASGVFAPPMAHVRWTMRAQAVPASPGLWNITVVVSENAASVTVATRRDRPVPSAVP